jgi:adenylate cyclase
MADVVVLNGAGDERRISCKEVTAIGRDGGNDVVLDDPHVSRRHAMICRLQDGAFYLVDEGSVNGCLLNSERIALPTLLSHGDQITIGANKLRFELPVTAPPPPLDGRATMLITQQSVEVVKIAILVADIRGFTALSESMPIQALTKLMNEWFRAATGCIKAHGGIVDKFLGDCVYARWEARGDTARAVINAVDAACQLNRLSRRMHDTHSELPRPLSLGVGVNLGDAAIGTDKGRTAMGDAVNIAFRLQAHSKKLHKDIVIADSAYKLLPESTWSGREVRLKVEGKTRPVDVLGLSFSEAEALLRLDHPTPIA